LDEWNEKKEMETDFYDSVPINLEALFILLFSRFEGNLEKLLDIFYKTFPDANTYEEKFTLKDLKEFHTISEVGQYVHDKQIFRIMHESNKNKFAWLKKNINFEFSETDQKIFDSLYATRNCIVHHDSIVTDTFVKPINEVFKLNPGNKKNGLGPEIIRGQEINLTQDLFAVSSNFFIIWGHKMILKFWSKMSKSESVFYLSTNLFFRYILLLHSNISTTRKLFETLLNSEITANHADKIDANLIYCLTIKMDEYDTVEVSKKLNEIDWTALSETYLIIKLGLLNDVEGVIDCMRHIGVNGSVKFIRRKFSLKEILSELFFDGVREDPKFVKTYKEIFGK
jgi:hypothetical protein